MSLQPSAGGGDGGDLRVSDEEREAAALEIREHYAAGRLDDDEMSSRLSAAYGAKRRAELAAVRADLPPLPPTPAAQKAELKERRSHLSRRLLQQTGAGVGSFAVCTAIWIAGGATGFFWPLFILLVAVLPLVRHGWSLYGPAPEFDRVERHLEQREREESSKRARHQARLERRSGGDRHRGGRL
jgi:hypothetical protein